MSGGFWFGLLAALSWAGVDLMAAYAGRRLGARAVTIGSLLAGLAGAVAMFAVLRPPLPGDPRVAGLLLLLGVPMALEYFAIFYSLKVGPISVVSPILSTAGVCAVALAVVFLGEHPHPLQAVAIPLAGAGCVLCALVFGGGWRPKFAGRGVLVALLAVLIGAALAVLLKYPVRHTDWVVAVVLLKLSATLAAGAGILLARARSSSVRQPVGVAAAAASAAGVAGATGSAGAWRRAVTPPVILAVLLMGVLDTLGLAAFTLGLTTGDAWLVSIVAATNPVVVVMGALLIYRERLRRTQWAGAALVAVALAVINAG